MKEKAKNLLKGSLFKYLVAGGCAAGAEYGSFAALFFVTDTMVFSNTLSYLLGLITSFTLNRFWVFNHGQHKKLSHQAGMYAVLVAFNLLLINGIVYVLHTAFGVSPYVGKLVGMVVITVWNFVAYNKIIFKKHETE